MLQQRGKVKFCGPLYDVDVYTTNEEGKEELKTSVRAWPSSIIVHPLSDIPVGVTFVYRPVDEPVRVRVPIKVINEEKCVGLRQGGWVNMLHKAIDINVAPHVEPPLYVTLDIGGMSLKEKRMIKDLEFDRKGDGCAAVLADDTVATIISKV